MKTVFFIFLTSILSYVYSAEQDIIINGKVVEYSDLRENFEKKYQIIKPILNLFKRPFAVLDIPAKQGYYSLRIEKDYPAVCVLLGKEDRLLNLCRANTQCKTLIYLSHPISINILDHLASCEHFDVVIAHDFPYANNTLDNIQYLNAIINTAENIILEIKTQNISPQFLNHLIEYLNLLNAVELGRTQGTNCSLFYYAYKKKSFLQRTHWLEPFSFLNKCRRIESSFEKKILYKEYGKVYCHSEWLPGINLMTFKICKGLFPEKASLKKDLFILAKVSHDDWIANNMIVGMGNHLQLIDFFDPNLYCIRAILSPKHLRLHMDFIDAFSQKEVKDKFYEILLHTQRAVRIYKAKKKKKN